MFYMSSNFIINVGNSSGNLRKIPIYFTTNIIVLLKVEKIIQYKAIILKEFGFILEQIQLMNTHVLL